MNKKDRQILCQIIAEWEWNKLPGSSEAGAVASCAKELRIQLQISSEDLAFYRAWEIYSRVKEETGREHDDDFFDALLLEVETDLESLVDDIEEMAWTDFASHIDSLIVKDN